MARLSERLGAGTGVERSRTATEAVKPAGQSDPGTRASQIVTAGKGEYA